MEDEEFIAGRLDTSFISEFNERRARLQRSESRSISAADKGIGSSEIALIAAALSKSRSHSAAPAAISNKPSRWVLAGRNKV